MTIEWYKGLQFEGLQGLQPMQAMPIHFASNWSAVASLSLATGLLVFFQPGYFWSVGARMFYEGGGVCLPATTTINVFFQAKKGAPGRHRYIITHPRKKYKRGGGYAPKNVLFTCFFLEFPREKFYTPRNVRGGGSKMDGVDKGSSNSPPLVWYILHMFWNSWGS